MITTATAATTAHSQKRSLDLAGHGIGAAVPVSGRVEVAIGVVAVDETITGVSSTGRRESARVVSARGRSWAVASSPFSG